MFLFQIKSVELNWIFGQIGKFGSNQIFSKIRKFGSNQIFDQIGKFGSNRIFWSNGMFFCSNRTGSLIELGIIGFLVESDIIFFPVDSL